MKGTATIREGEVCLRFGPHDRIARYDDWTFFRAEFRHTAGGSGGVDGVCITREHCWLIEIKARARLVGDDYGLKVTDAIVWAASQIRDTLAGLAAAARNARGEERAFAVLATAAKAWRVALHLEQGDRTSALHPMPYDLADATMKLRQLVHPIDRNAVVVDSTGDRNPSNARVPWEARRHDARQNGRANA